MLEQQIFAHTSDLEQSNVKELNRLIISGKDKIKVLSMNLYEYLNKEESILVINQNGDVLYYIDKWENLKDNYHQKIPPVQLEAIDDGIDQLFATDTIEDIILTYNKHEYIKPHKIQGQVLNKTLFNRNLKNDKDKKFYYYSFVKSR